VFSGTGLATSTTLGFSYVVRVDNAGNLYTTGSALVTKVDVTSSELLFGSINVGQTSSPQSVWASDVGNMSLSFTEFSAPAFIGTQLVDNTCSTGTPLTVGATCILAAGTSSMAFYLSTSTNPKWMHLGNRSLGSLAVNAFSTATTTLTLPANLHGTYSVTACANAYNTVADSNTANNCSATTSITLP